jgi:hypothetical protein
MTKHEYTELRNPWSPEHAESNWPRAHVLAAENAKLRAKLEQRGIIVAKLLEQIASLQAQLAERGKTDGQAD